MRTTLMAAPLLTLANEAAALLAQTQQLLTEVDRIGDAVRHL
jgi:hypothetical protein